MASRFGRGYGMGMAIVGGGLLTLSAILSISRDLSFETLLLLGLAIAASWLRITFEPFGEITLALLVVFTAVVLVDSMSLLLITSVSALVGSALFARNPALVAFRETGEHAISILLGVFPFLYGWFASDLSAGLIWPPRIAMVILIYACARLILSAAGAKVLEGVRPRAFFSEAGKLILGNILFFAVVASAIAYLVQRYGNLGYLTLVLATATLIDSYHPYKLLSEQRHALYASLAMISQAIDLKDVYTGKHARDVSTIAVRIARVMDLPEREVRRIRIAGLLHDIGKIGVSGRIIRKPAKLEPSEMAMMREHPVIGAEIMQPVELLADAAEVVRHHHEHFNGSGYPDGLNGNETPIGSRVVLVADAFNAMTTDRPYRKGLPKKDAVAILEKHSGTQFDPQVVKSLQMIVGFI